MVNPHATEFNAVTGSTARLTVPRRRITSHCLGLGRGLVQAAAANGSSSATASISWPVISVSSSA
jgi:hypothetical protein